MTGFAKDRLRFILLLGLLPLLVLGGGYLGHRISTAASLLNPVVSLANRWLDEGNLPPQPGPLSPDALALERARQNPEQLLDHARAIQKKFSRPSIIFGAWIGAVLGIKLLSLSLYRRRTEFEPSSGDCFACARCFEFCPNELVRRGVLPVPTEKTVEEFSAITGAGK